VAIYPCSECGKPTEKRRVCWSCYGRLRAEGKVRPRSEQGLHSLTEVDRDARTAVCSVCGVTRVYVRSRNGRHDVSCVAQGAEGRARSRKATTLYLKYGVTLDQYEALALAQQRRCAICRRESGKPLCVDHNHASGQVRGLLCWHCNIALGKFQDDPMIVLAAWEYLRRYVSDRKEPK
jgi:hypothetical protein